MSGRPFNPDISDRSLLYAAARTIEADAKCLRDSHTLNGRWVLMAPEDHSAKADYDDRMLLVRELRARARDAD